ncbi:hypothetical protein [Vibrio quintilis]|uniref:hypothetical protein n=1 Tax=Vibrio quintilis TaxID=1117707 RepID=UPI0009372308|nr:hypothetical protein [Vibrio quintilis]
MYANIAYFKDWIAAKTSGVSYPQRFNTLSSDQNIQVETPLTNYGTESFDVTNFELPEGVTVASNTCTSTLNQGDSCAVTMNIDRKAAGFLSYQAGQDLTYKIITDHAEASELQVKVHFNNIYQEDATESAGSTTGSGSTSSSSGSGGASFGLLIFSLFGLIIRRRYR